jgi:hypothetical protein
MFLNRHESSLNTSKYLKVKLKIQQNINKLPNVYLLEIINRCSNKNIQQTQSKTNAAANK